MTSDPIHCTERKRESRARIINEMKKQEGKVREQQGSSK